MSRNQTFRRRLAVLATVGLAMWPLAAQSAPGAAARNATAAVAGDGPRIEFLDTKYNFGRVSAGQTIRQNFEFKNTGNQPLEIRSVQPSCGCTTAGEWSKLVAPGQTGAIPIQLATTNFKGAIHKTVTVVSSAVNTPVITLNLDGEVWVPVSVNPPYLYFSLVAGRAEAVTRTTRIANNTEQPMEILGVESTSDLFHTEVRTITPGKEYDLIASVEGKLPASSNQGSLKIKTTLKETPEIEVKVYAYMQDPIVATPSHLILPAGPLPGPVKRYVTIRSNESDPVTVAAPELVGAKNVEAQVTETLKGRMFRVELVFPAGFELEAGQQAAVKVGTSHPDYPVFTLPIVQPRQATRPTVTARTPTVVPVPRPAATKAATAAPPDFGSPVPSLVPGPEQPPLPPAPLPPKSR